MKDEAPDLNNSRLPILIVDDNPQYSKLLSRILEAGFGYNNITAVANTEAALALLTSSPERFKMLFIDFNFPSGLSGGQLLEELKTQNLLTDKVAFLVTSEPSTENVRQATAAGAIGVVAKPFDREALSRHLERAMRFLFAKDVEYF